jgi:hypothetical protein
MRRWVAVPLLAVALGGCGAAKAAAPAATNPTVTTVPAMFVTNDETACTAWGLIRPEITKALTTSMAGALGTLNGTGGPRQAWFGLNLWVQRQTSSGNPDALAQEVGAAGTSLDTDNPTTLQNAAAKVDGICAAMS